MKASLAVSACISALLAVLAAGCRSSGPHYNHWQSESIGPRLGYHFLGWEADEDGPYLEKLERDGANVWLTARRHFLNDNPENPLQHSEPVPPPRIEHDWAE
jgi:hypothetical protein